MDIAQHREKIGRKKCNDTERYQMRKIKPLKIDRQKPDISFL